MNKIIQNPSSPPLTCSTETVSLYTNNDDSNSDIVPAFIEADYPNEKDELLDKIKKAREEIWKNVYEYSGSGNEVTQAYCDGFKASLNIIDKLFSESEEK
jgi:hypothetical protein